MSALWRGGCYRNTGGQGQGGAFSALKRSAPVLLLSCMAGLAAAPAAAQTLYKSIGPDGAVVYSDRPPPGGRVEKTMKFDNLPASALPAATTAHLEQQLKNLRASSAAAAPAGDVVLYSAQWCGYCKKAKAWLAENRVAYREVDIDTPDGMASFAQAGGGKGVPLLLAGGERVQGFSTGAYGRLFAAKK